MTAINGLRRWRNLRVLGTLAVAALFVKVLFSILIEYQWYFPPDFEHAGFLSGRQDSFNGAYRAAFYAHIISGPLAVLLGAFLMISGVLSQYRRIHRLAGKLLLLIVFVLVVPSGMVMAQQAYAGALSALGFTSLAMATGFCATAAGYFAMTRRFQSHQRWATRCFLLLASPLLLRLISGAVIVMQQESELTYRLNAWLSWLVPLAIYEVWWRCSARDNIGATLRSRQRAIQVEALP